MPVKGVWKQFTRALILDLGRQSGRGRKGLFHSARVASLFVAQILRFMEIGRGGEGAEIKLVLLSIYSIRLAS